MNTIVSRRGRRVRRENPKNRLLNFGLYFYKYFGFLCVLCVLEAGERYMYLGFGYWDLEVGV
jgi:hypothetical protein